MDDGWGVSVHQCSFEWFRLSDIVDFPDDRGA